MLRKTIVAIALYAAATTAAMAETGMASWYGSESGTHTANGERWIPMGLTAAHLKYRFGTRLRVTDLATGKSVVVRVNDRGPARWTGRIIDLSKGAAHALGIVGRGTARVRIEPLN